MKNNYKDCTDLSGFMEAEVRDNVDPLQEGRIKLYIPRLMFHKKYEEKPITIEETSKCNNIVNEKDFKGINVNIKSNNYIWARPVNLYEPNNPNWKDKKKYENSGSYRIPRIGTIVICFFLDNDPHKCYYLPLSLTKSGDEITGKYTHKTENWYNENKRPNIDVIRHYWNNTRIEEDTNENTFTITNSNGNVVKMSDDYIKLEFYRNGNITEVTEDYIKTESGKNKHKTKVTDEYAKLESGNDNSFVLVDNDKVLIKQGNNIIKLEDGEVYIEGPTAIDKDVIINGDLKVGGNIYCDTLHDKDHPHSHI